MTPPVVPVQTSGESPQYVDPPIAPSFVEWTPENLQTAFRVVASRNGAYYGFNTPEIQLHLPMVGNSTYCHISMPEPRLLDNSGNEVAFQLERGLHDSETQIAEIRFLNSDGESPAEFARAVGSLTLTYPVLLETHTCQRGRKAKDAAVECSIDGAFVDVLDGTLPEAAPFSALEPVRAFDATGRQLQRDPMASTFVDSGRVERFGFHGEVDRVEIDTLSRLVEVTIDYDVPIAQPIPEESRGMSWSFRGPWLTTLAARSRFQLPRRPNLGRDLDPSEERLSWF